MKRARALVLVAAALSAACSATDPCEGAAAICVRARIDSQVGPLDQLLLSVASLGERRTPTVPAELHLPVAFAIHLPAATSSPVAFVVDGYRGGARLASGHQSVIVTDGRGTLDLVLGADQLTDLGDVPDLAMPSDGSADLQSTSLDLPVSTDLAALDLTTPPSADLLPPTDLAGTVELDVIVFGINGGTGTIEVSAGTPCGPGCYHVPANDSVTITATAASDSHLVAMSGDCPFGPSPTCMLTMATGKTVLVSFESNATPANRAFVTKALHKLDELTSEAAVDQLCRGAASDAGLPDASGYVAWLSWSTASATSRLGTARGWVRTDGLPFADRIVDLTQGNIRYPPFLDEHGEPGTTYHWTGTNPNGSLGNNCADWSSASSTAIVGTPLGGSTNWTFYTSTFSCGTTKGYSLLCLGTAQANPLEVVTTTRPTRGAFTTNGLFAPSLASSLTSADALCNAEKSAAGLLGVYRAFLSTSTQLAINRFDLSRGPWARLDGVLLSGSPSRLDPLSTVASTTHMLAPPDKNNLGQPQPFEGYWVGGTFLGHCSDWTDGSAGAMGTIEDRTKLHDGPRGTQCNQPQALLCLED